MGKLRKIELLAPAKNLECGLEAINHGADAVYIGAPKFGARSAAGNSLDDIQTLVKHAHLYNARIYVTVNTILKEEELLENDSRDFRYLVFKSYKIIYLINLQKNRIEIFDVFDTRQHPLKVKRGK